MEKIDLSFLRKKEPAGQAKSADDGLFPVKPAADITPAKPVKSFFRDEDTPV